MPKVSIIVPAYNAESYIKKTIDSILSQTYSDFECIVIDDGSNDKTVSMLGTYSDERIKLISQENSGGPAKPRNVGVRSAKGELIFIFDSDDLMFATKVEEYVAAFDKYENIDVMFSDFSMIDEADHCLKESFLCDYKEFRQSMTVVEDNLYALDMSLFPAEIIKANFVGTSSVCFRRKLADNTTLFDESFSSGDDKLAWLRLAKVAQFAFLDKVLHSYRKRKNSISNNNVEKLLINKISILESIAHDVCDKTKFIIARKKNEYYFSLGYFYRKSKRFSEAKKAYWSISGLVNSPSIFIQTAKVYAEEIVTLLRRKAV